MLQLKHIVKRYPVGGEEIEALAGVDITFRECEFVSVLGPSGCGKTTLLNIIGGLDRYTSGDLLVNGRSTKDFKARDWDTYRNHTIGFVFQSYNLIPHQTVLANVELALTLSGVSKAERRRRAQEALEKVGLGDQLRKKPNQMSGGQMQRVAIARALVNDPDILLADEPTGALDSTTSVQIMNLLQEIAQTRLVIMVTHNPELADRYSTRLVRLLDGRIIDDTDPYTPQEAPVPAPVRAAKGKKSRTSMSFLTALSLSTRNLMTKKTRTLLTSFAGSIGIIGIALILSLSNGIQAYINTVQKETLSSYPITLQAESTDMTALMTAMMGSHTQEQEHEEDAVYSSSVMYDMLNAVTSAETTTNNLADFKAYLESGEADLSAAAAIQYTYDLDLNFYTKDENGNIVRADLVDMMQNLVAEMYGMDESGAQSYGALLSSSGMQSFGGMTVWEEMLPGSDGALVADRLSDQYDLLYGSWPTSYNEVMLFVNENNEISDMCLYALGLEPESELREVMEAYLSGREIEAVEHSWSYEEIAGQTFHLILGSSYYQYDAASGTWKDLSSTATGLQYLYDQGIELTISGIARPSAEATSSMMSGAIGYTAALTQQVIEQGLASDAVKAQLAAPDTDIFTGLPFADENAPEPTTAEKAAAARESCAKLTAAEKAALYTQVASVPSSDYLEQAVNESMAGVDRATIEQLMMQSTLAETGMESEQLQEYVASMDDDTLMEYARQAIAAQITQQYAAQVQAQLGSMTTDQLAAALDRLLPTLDEQTLAEWNDSYLPETLSDSTYSDNLHTLGWVDTASPTAINLYANTFEDKDALADVIAAYNDTVEEDDRITYTDYVKLLMSSITTIIQAITYVLVAFVAISLVVSSIMIGIITYISVLERTKEIGILRAIGASKRDVSRVFNAETLLIGLTAGLLGIGLSLLLCVPINLIIHALTGMSGIRAALPLAGGVALVAISMVLTLIAGLIPSRMAAKKDPVVALRTE